MLPTEDLKMKKVNTPTKGKVSLILRFSCHTFSGELQIRKKAETKFLFLTKVFSYYPINANFFWELQYYKNTLKKIKLASFWTLI